MTDRRFNLDKFRVLIRLTVKSSAGHSRIIWAEWQTYKVGSTEIFGVYTWRFKPIERVIKATFNEQGAPSDIY